MSHSDTKIAQGLIRNFIMERFIERMSVSKYHAQFILKGGMLVASLIGVDLRSTMDVDATIRALPLNEMDARKMIQEIIDISMEDGVTFEIISCRKRETVFQKEDTLCILNRIETDLEMQNRWEKFCKDNYFVGNMEWQDVIGTVEKLLNLIYTLVK